MKFLVHYTDETSTELDIDHTWIWVRLEQDLGLTTLEAQEKMGKGSTLIMTHALWIAAETTAPFTVWVKTLKDVDFVGDPDPKEDTPGEASSVKS